MASKDNSKNIPSRSMDNASLEEKSKAGRNTAANTVENTDTAGKNTAGNTRRYVSGDEAGSSSSHTFHENDK